MSMEGETVPESAVRAVSKKLKHYIDVQRREEGFDQSGPWNYFGDFCSGRGLAGTFHYNSLQDRHLQHYFEQPLIRKHLEAMGVVHPGMLKSPKDKKKKQTLTFKQETNRTSAVKMENKRLLEATATVLLTNVASDLQSQKNSLQRASTHRSTKMESLGSSPQINNCSSASLQISPSNTVTHSQSNGDVQDEVYQRSYSSTTPNSHCVSSDKSHKMSSPSCKQDHLINIDSTNPKSSTVSIIPIAQDNIGTIQRTCPCICHQCHQPLRSVCDVVRCSDASTQTPVESETQTDLSVRIQ